MVLSDEERKANRREYRKKNKEKLNRQARARGNQYQEQVTW
jgi:hypothetical protein